MTIENKEECLSLARALTMHLEADDIEQAEQVIQKITAERAESLYNEVGRLTRELHDALNSFLEDEQLAEIAHVEIPDASERLRYVIATTEQAANSTLSAVEASVPLVDGLKDRAGQLMAQWRAARESGDDKEALLHIGHEIEAFLSEVRDDAGSLHARLSEVLIAQGFQDITGQIIRKVIDLVQNVEDKLVELVRLSGRTAPERKANAADELEGPAVPGVSQGEMITDQDDVDDLLSSLGF